MFLFFKRKWGVSIPQIETPKWEPISPVQDSPEILLEGNNWKRHKELLDVHGASLKTQEAILIEQKSTSRLTFWILLIILILLGITGFSLWLQTR